jgi:hypothetical protein
MPSLRREMGLGEEGKREKSRLMRLPPFLAATLSPACTTPKRKESGGRIQVPNTEYGVRSNTSDMVMTPPPESHIQLNFGCFSILP